MSNVTRNFLKGLQVESRIEYLTPGPGEIVVGDEAGIRRQQHVTPGPGEMIVGGVDGPVAHSLGHFNVTPDVLPRWRKAIARVQAGTGFAKVLCVGDSTTYGEAVGGPSLLHSYPYVLARMLDRGYVPAAPGFAIPKGVGSGSAQDPRWVAGTGWAASPYGFAEYASWLVNGATPGVGTLTFTPGIRCDKFDVYYLTNTALGSISISVDGGAPVVRDTKAAKGWGKVTVTAPLGDAHTLTVTPSVATVAILGIEPYDSTRPAVLVGNAGISSSATDSWIRPESHKGFPIYAPDLTIIMLGINDSKTSRLHTAAQLTANLTTLLGTVQPVSDVILASFAPSDPATADPTGLQAGYVKAIRQLAADRGCGYVGIYERFGSYAKSNAVGLMADGAHPNAAGAADMAAAFFHALRQV